RGISRSIAGLIFSLSGRGQLSDPFFRMRPINLRLGNKSIGKSLITALAPLLGRYREAASHCAGPPLNKAAKSSTGSISFWPRASAHSVASSPFFLQICAGQKITSVWHLALGRWLASSARFRVGYLPMQCGGNEVWRGLAFA